MRVQAVVLAVLLMACGEGDKDAFQARFEVYFLTDEQTCYRCMEVASDGSGVASIRERAELPAESRTFVLTEPELQEFLADVELARTVEWAPSYESPARSDNWRFRLELSDADGARRTVLEPASSEWPEHLAPLMTRMLDTYRANLP
ncbi:hypothetical protein [Corallococcus macrosporus]|uniref:Lipoprotein n=1 Tax=Myxococcus fulvus (strain ATCC BAA-855 / HW-1) TaxID=483219 RepID=F8CQY0_MYXFH|nr:hypothetical protein [Corallococcus macrosporus]AEI63024.1 hypothetical protein LILAB_05515 [Corallococcus macrosporus]